MSTKVLIIDDSALIRKYLADIIRKTEDLELADTAHDPLFAMEKLKKTAVDVILLDIEMPRMDGLTFLQQLMKHATIPVIIISSLTQKNAAITLQAFEYGAFDVIAKPEDVLEMPEIEQSIVGKIREAAKAAVKKNLRKNLLAAEQLKKAKQETPNSLFTKKNLTTDKLIAIGASTGGTTAIENVLSHLPVDVPGIVIVQHMPVYFTSAFAERLDRNVALKVKLARNGDQVLNGFAYIAPGDRHCTVRAEGAKYYISIKDGPRVNYHKPSVTVLFNSVANYVGRNAIGVMLTGMGEDGAKAMTVMKQAGSYNIVQDEESSIVWGMPGKAVEYGAAHKVVPLERISAEIIEYIQNHF